MSQGRAKTRFQREEPLARDAEHTDSEDEMWEQVGLQARDALQRDLTSMTEKMPLRQLCLLVLIGREMTNH